MSDIFHLTTVHPRYDPRILYKECVSLANNGYKVRLFVSDQLPDENFHGVQIESLGVYRNRLNINMILKILRKTKTVNPSIIHFHDPELIIVGLLIKLFFRIKVIYDVHEDCTTSIYHKKYPKFFRFILYSVFLILEFIAKKCFIIIIAEKYYSIRFPGSTPILNYPIISSFTDSIERNYNTNKLLYTGNVTTIRGGLIHAGIINNSDKYEIHYVGKCTRSTYSLIKEEVKGNIDRVHFESIDEYIPYNIIKKRYSEDWLAGLAIFPMSNHYYKKELTKLFEYMYEGLPVICSGFDVWRDLIENNNCGICVDPCNEEEIIAAIDFLLENEDKAKELGLNGRRLIQEKYNWFEEEKKLIELYLTVSV